MTTGLIGLVAAGMAVLGLWMAIWPRSAAESENTFAVEKDHQPKPWYIEYYRVIGILMVAVMTPLAIILFLVPS